MRIVAMLGKIMRLSRKLTEGEIALLRMYFSGHVAYEKVRVYRGAIFADGLTLNNAIRFSKDYYTDDFSTSADLHAKALFVHEMVHVWQFQRKIQSHAKEAVSKGKYWWFLAFLEHVKFGARVYDYTISPDKTLTDYRFEQMGQVVQDYVLGGDKDVQLRRIIGRSIPVHADESGTQCAELAEGVRP